MTFTDYHAKYFAYARMLIAQLTTRLADLDRLPAALLRAAFDS